MRRRGRKGVYSPLPATVPAPAVSFSYASMAARPSTSFAVSGGDNTIGAAAAHIPESDVSKVRLFDSFARAILNRPVPGPVESPAGLNLPIRGLPGCAVSRLASAKPLRLPGRCSGHV